MYIKEIELKNFRNYGEEKISFNERVNVFLGNNAQGKTNLLEGIYLNSIGRSFRNAADRDLIRFGEEFCRVKSLIGMAGDEETIETVIRKDGKKGIKIGGAKVMRTSELLERSYVVVFSPEDLKIVKDEPEKRRSFMDMELCRMSKGYLSDLKNYRRIVKQRNAGLKNCDMDENIMDIWDRGMAEYGSRIIKRRRSFAERIDGISGEIHSQISGGRENLNIRYEPSVYFDDDMEGNFRELLYRNRGEDMRRRTTCRGPHRDDLKISAQGRDLRKFGSQGQQRTAALSMKLSEIKLIEGETGEKPVLLLDDVLSELDDDRQIYLINSLGENQMFITATGLAGAAADNLPESKIYRIKNGRIER